MKMIFVQSSLRVPASMSCSSPSTIAQVNQTGTREDVDSLVGDLGGNEWMVPHFKTKARFILNAKAKLS